MIWLVAETLFLMLVAVAFGVFVGAVAKQFLGTPGKSADASLTGAFAAAVAADPPADAAPAGIDGGELASEAIETVVVEVEVAAEAVLPDLDRAAAADAVGCRPAALSRPRGDNADDLKAIKGIGPQNERRLNALGIFHIDQIALWSPDEAKWVGAYLAFPGRIEREDWVGQARRLAGNAAV